MFLTNLYVVHFFIFLISGQRVGGGVGFSQVFKSV